MKTSLLILLLLVAIVCHGQTVNDLRPTVTMKEYVDMQAELNRQLTMCRSEANRSIADVQFENISDNVNKANTATEKRFDGVNEFRLQLKDQAGTFITRGELFAWIIAIIGIFFGYSNWKRGQQKETEGKAIISGDKVKVEK